MASLPSCANKPTKIPSAKIARERRKEDIQICKKVGKSYPASRVFLFTDKLIPSQRHIGQFESTTEKRPQNNFQEETLGCEEDRRICPLEDRDRVFEGSVSRKNQHCNMCAGGIVNPEASPLMK